MAQTAYGAPTRRSWPQRAARSPRRSTGTAQERALQLAGQRALRTPWLRSPAGYALRPARRKASGAHHWHRPSARTRATAAHTEQSHGALFRGVYSAGGQCLTNSSVSRCPGGSHQAHNHRGDLARGRVPQGAGGAVLERVATGPARAAGEGLLPTTRVSIHRPHNAVRTGSRKNPCALIFFRGSSLVCAREGACVRVMCGCPASPANAGHRAPADPARCMARSRERCASPNSSQGLWVRRDPARDSRVITFRIPQVRPLMESHEQEGGRDRSLGLQFARNASASSKWQWCPGCQLQ